MCPSRIHCKLSNAGLGLASSGVVSAHFLDRYLVGSSVALPFLLVRFSYSEFVCGVSFGFWLPRGIPLGGSSNQATLLSTNSEWKVPSTGKKIGFDVGKTHFYH